MTGKDYQKLFYHIFRSVQWMCKNGHDRNIKFVPSPWKMFNIAIMKAKISVDGFNFSVV